MTVQVTCWPCTCLAIFSYKTHTGVIVSINFAPRTAEPVGDETQSQSLSSAGFPEESVPGGVILGGMFFQVLSLPFHYLIQGGLDLLYIDLNPICPDRVTVDPNHSPITSLQIHLLTKIYLQNQINTGGPIRGIHKHIQKGKNASYPVCTFPAMGEQESVLLAAPAL